MVGTHQLREMIWTAPEQEMWACTAVRVEGHMWDPHLFDLLQNLFFLTPVLKFVSGIKFDSKVEPVLGNQTVSGGIPMPWGLISYVAILLEWPLALLCPQTTF